jgi:hypothetical protein
MDNHIGHVREEIKKYFFEENRIAANAEKISSPSGEFSIIKNDYRQTQKDVNWIVSKLEIFDSKNNHIFSVILDNDQFFHQWFTINDHEYLFFAENMCGGNSLFNLTGKTFESFADGTDGYICAEYIISPGKLRMAAVGCYWGTPYFVRVFDISNVESLPWPVIQDIELLDEENTTIHWVNENKIQVFKHSESGLVKSREVNIGKDV